MMCLAAWLEQALTPLHVLHYVTFRMVAASLTGFFLVLFFMPSWIAFLKRQSMEQVVRTEGPKSHLSKQGTPTMGGVLIVFAMVLSLVLWGDFAHTSLWLLLFVLLGFACIGGIDDWAKIKEKKTAGLSAKGKLIGQVSVSVLAFAALIYCLDGFSTELALPFLKAYSLELGVAFWFWALCVVVGSSNAVNLTDGLDGLAIMIVVMVACGLAAFAYIAGHYHIANYLGYVFMAGGSEVAVFAAAMAGSGLGFLWYNTHPAQVFMGDTGSLSLGASLGMMALLIHQEILFFFMAFVMVLETVSVIIQVAYFRRTQKRFFKMAPLHHHFELSGWSEPQVIVRFWIITMILVLFCLATIKLR